MVLTLLPTVTLAGTTTDYDIWVGATRATSENADNVTGTSIDGSVTYDAYTNTGQLGRGSGRFAKE